MNRSICVEVALTDWTLPEDEILQQAFQAVAYGIDTIVCLPAALPNLSNYLRSNEINIELAALLDWPTGCGLPQSKEKIVIDAIRAGATVVDLVCNSSLIDEGNLKFLKRDVRGAIAVATELKTPIRIVLSHEHLSLELVLKAGKALFDMGIVELIIRTGKPEETSDEVIVGHLVQEKTGLGVTVNINSITKETADIIKKCEIVGIQTSSIPLLGRFCRLYS